MNKKNAQKIKTVSDYFEEYRSVKKKLEFEDISKLKKVKIAILSSSTIQGIEKILSVECYNLGIIPEIFIGGYKQYYQEVLDKTSSLYEFKPDLIIISIDTHTLLGDAYFSYFQLAEEEKKRLFKNGINEVTSLVDNIKKNLNSKVIFHNFEVPIYSPLGIIDNKQELGFIEFVKKINSELEKRFKLDNQIFIFDYETFCSKWGKNNITDYKMYYLGDIKINLKYLPKLCGEYISYIKPLMSMTKKCIVLDLDNTLWGGIIGEDGLAGIRLGPNPEGKPFVEFQKYILSLFNRGIILAINSKNNLEDALDVIKNHPYMILREENFASIKINWNDKVSNIKEIAKELSIGLDSLVFFDDDKLNREMVKLALPEVEVVDLPEDPSLYLKVLMELNDFNSFYFSEEDKKKGVMYVDQRRRSELSEVGTDITEYLKALDMSVVIERATPFNIPRISQLTQKTNQFNMTTRRYLEENIKQFSDNNNYFVFSVKVEDKFGDNGLTGIAIIEKKERKWIIDSFLLSCRVIGRRIEETILAYILEEAEKEKVDVLIGEFIPTKKNDPAKDFYRKNGFELIGEKKDMQLWKFPVEKSYKYPEFIKIVKK